MVLRMTKKQPFNMSAISSISKYFCYSSILIFSFNSLCSMVLHKITRLYPCYRAWDCIYCHFLLSIFISASGNWKILEHFYISCINILLAGSILRRYADETLLMTDREEILQKFLEKLVRESGNNELISNFLLYVSKCLQVLTNEEQMWRNKDVSVKYF